MSVKGLEDIMRGFLKVNEHPAERIGRAGLGAALLGLTVTGVIGWWGYLGIVPFVTGLVGSCPIYTLAGISTCPSPRHP
jgi:hypothetical protein